MSCASEMAALSTGTRMPGALWTGMFGWLESSGDQVECLNYLAKHGASGRSSRSPDLYRNKVQIPSFKPFPLSEESKCAFSARLSSLELGRHFAHALLQCCIKLAWLNHGVFLRAKGPMSAGRPLASGFRQAASKSADGGSDLALNKAELRHVGKAFERHLLLCV